MARRPRHASDNRHRAPKRRSRVTVSSVLGELFLTLGVLLLGFIGWKFYLNDYFIGREEITNSAELSQQLEKQHATIAPADFDEDGVPVRAIPKEEATPYGIMYVPAWGEDFSRRIASGIDRDLTLDSAFVGTYLDSAPPGGKGNYTLAAHRNTYGGAFRDLDRLMLGDKVYLETVDGWYTYEFRSGEYVVPTAVDVLAGVPHHPDLPKNERVLTMITCNPSWSMEERIISYFTLVDFTPREDGPPAEIKYAYELREQSGGKDHGGNAD